MSLEYRRCVSSDMQIPPIKVAKYSINLIRLSNYILLKSERHILTRDTVRGIRSQNRHPVKPDGDFLKEFRTLHPW